MIYIRIFFLSIVFAVSGCTVSKPPPNLDEHTGLNTVPFYREGSLAFDTRAAINRDRARKEEEEKRREEVSETIKGRLEGGISAMENPTVPPPVRKPADLPIALRGFPKDRFGYPDWAKAADTGIIKPSGTLLGGKEEKEPPQPDIVFVINDALMSDVIFPHEAHSYWLSCKNCHPAIFKAKKGTNEFSMQDVWNGEYCGKCHGSVAFMPKGFENCQRCHSAKKKM
jgi:c(7)-type cytochrome triheme protein